MGTRLYPFTESLNKALIKLGDKPIISHIIEQYPKNTRFIVTLGHLGDQVKDYLQIVHQDINFEFIYVDNYSGPGSSLLKSLSYVFGSIKSPFIFNACDTLVKNIDFGFSDINLAFSGLAPVSNQYRAFFDEISDIPAEINEPCYVGLCYVHDVIGFKKISLELLASENGGLSDAHVLRLLGCERVDLNKDNWIDVGNLISLRKARDKFNSKINVLPKEKEETYFDKNLIVKFFAHEDKLKKIESRGIQLSNCTPEFNVNGNFLYYSYIEGDTLSHVLNKEILYDFLDWCLENLWTPILSNITPEDFFNELYYEKTKSRIHSYLEKHDKNNTIKSINFCEVINILDLIEDLKNYNKKDKILFTRSHGDLVFENVIKSKYYTLIDWRESFPGDAGDLYYDLAKMKHNLYFDHSAIIGKKFKINQQGNSVFFDCGIPEKNYKLIKDFDNWCLSHNFDQDHINLIVSVIQLSSAGMHTGDDTNLLFFNGWYNLNKALLSTTHD